MPDLNWPELLLSVVLAAALGEITDWLPRLSDTMVKRAARSLSTRAPEREHEWLAILDQLPGKWSKFGYALSCLRIARAPLLNSLLDRLQPIFIWLARISLLVGVPEGTRRAWSEGDTGALVAVAVLVLLLGPALGRRSFDPPWFPAGRLPDWVWRAELVICGLVVVDSLWFGHAWFAAAFCAGMTLLYGRDFRRAGLWQTRRRPVN